MKCLKNFTMKINKKTVKKLITHNGTFHADDVFACVTLSLMLEKNGEKFKIIRTRDEKIIKGGDYVFDIGGVYDEKTNRYKPKNNTYFLISSAFYNQIYKTLEFKIEITEQKCTVRRNP